MLPQTKQTRDTQVSYVLRDDHIMVVFGGQAHLIHSTNPVYPRILRAIRRRRPGILPMLVTVAESQLLSQAIEKGKIKVDGDNVFYEGTKLVTDHATEIVKLWRVREVEKSLDG